MELKNLKKLNPEGKQNKNIASYGAGLPNSPGVYFFMRGRKILYIGKATSLRDRVRSYWSKDLIETRGPIVADMVFQADKVEWQATDTVLEALILEANLIKKHQPQANTKEKDNKSFNYVCITREKLPRVLVVRGRVLENYKGSIFGPYTNGRQLGEALKIVRRIFPFIDDSSSKKQNYQFYKQIGLTPDTKAPSELYLSNIKYLKLFFAGKKKSVMREIKKEMMQRAKNREFEQATELKRQLFAIQHINDVALIKEENLNPSIFRIEAYDIAHMSGKSMVGVMTVVDGHEPDKSQYRKFRIRTQEGANDTGALKEVLTRRLAHEEWPYPNLIVMDGFTAQINSAKKALGEAGMNIPVVSVIKDERHRPRGFGGDKELAHKYEREILLANSEAHRFAITYHKNLRGKKFLGK
ncbi:MAG: hypothetical protein WCT29_02675 [Candidatus Paceibacterota bacterium]|jgi:excinuclease UvrABC nuclease subunit